MKKYLIKYGFEFVVIFLGILISLYFEQSRQNRIENDRKNKSIEQLIKVINQDISQIDNFITLQEISLESCLVLYDNLNQELNLSNDKKMYHSSSVGRALKSFFPQEGIFNQLISSDLIKRINSETLKNKLFKLLITSSLSNISVLEPKFSRYSIKDDSICCKLALAFATSYFE